MKSPELNPHYNFRIVDASIMMLISLVALTYAGCTGFTAFHYNSIDMLPFLERKLHPDFLPHDFFTNASVTPNSRQIWGYFLLGLSKILNNNPYLALYFSKLIFVATAGALYYKALTVLYSKFGFTSPLLFRVFSALFILLVVSNPFFIQLFMMAWWHPYFADASAHNFSILFGLLALIFYHKSFSFLFVFIAGLIHPVIGIAFAGFTSLFFIRPRNYYRILLLICSGILIPYAIHQILFRASSGLSADEFVKIYAYYRHPNHYVPSYFGKMAFSSLFIYCLTTFLLILAFFAGRYFKQRAIQVASVGGLLVINAIIIIQFLYIEKYPVKLIAVLGPSRYLTFTGWLICFLYAYIFAFIFSDKKWGIALQNFSDKLFAHRNTLIGSGILTVFLICLLVIKQDAPSSRETRALQWIRENTPSHAVIACHSRLIDEMDLRYVARRAVLAGECFPFSETNFREYYLRASLLYGSLEEIQKPGEDIAKGRFRFYEHLTPERIGQVLQKRHFDYIVISAKNKEAFKNISPAYQNETLAIYAASSFLATP